MWIRILRVILYIQFRLKESIAFVFVHNYKSFEHTTGIKYRVVCREIYIALHNFYLGQSLKPELWEPEMTVL